MAFQPIASTSQSSYHRRPSPLSSPLRPEISVIPDAADTDFFDESDDRETWSPETSPTSSDISSASSTDYPRNPSSSSSTQPSGLATSSSHPNMPSIAITAASPTSSTLGPRSPKSPTTSTTITSMHPYRSVSAPLPNRPAQRTRGVMAMSAMPSPPPNSSCLPKSQPLARALFARMTDTSNAGLGAGLAPKKGNAAAKQKMLVATKPMRTTFELGLTASELARKA